MEDGVTEAESLVPPLNHSSEDGSEKAEEKKEGFVSPEKVEKVKQEDEGKDGSSGGGGGGGGLINNLISTLITPLSSRTGKATTEHESENEVFESEKGTVADGGGNGEKGRVGNGEDKGLISNLVSNFFHRSESEEGVVETEKEKEDEETLGGEETKRLKTENEGNNGGGGIIHDIVSHLPASLPEIKIHKLHMEDGVTEAESLVPPLNHSPEDGSQKAEEKKEGFVSTEKVEKVKQEDEGKDSSSGGGGLIDNLISTLITPLSPRTGKATTEHESENEVFESEKGTVADGGGNGEKGRVDNGEDKGLISNLISNFFHRRESEEGVVETEKEKEDEETLDGEKIKRLKTENEGNNGGGGIIHDIVSHLPASLPDDVAPTADEATILINSLVRD